MPAYNIKGITVEIGGDTKNFNTALDELNRKVNSSATEIGKLNRLLKLDPSNTVLLTQKQGLLTKEIAASKTNLQHLPKRKNSAVKRCRTARSQNKRNTASCALKSKKPNCA